MSVTVRNLFAGPCDVHVAPFGTTEPVDALAAPGAGWDPVGGTTGGARLNIVQEHLVLEVDQILEDAGRVPTKLASSVATTMAEATLENWARAVNMLASAVTSTGTAPAAVTETLEIGSQDLHAEPNYVAVMLTGPGPAGKRRRVILRRVLATESIESASGKQTQAGIPVTWANHYVSPSIKSIKKMDTLPATA